MRRCPVNDSSIIINMRSDNQPSSHSVSLDGVRRRTDRTLRRSLVGAAGAEMILQNSVCTFLPATETEHGHAIHIDQRWGPMDHWENYSKVMRNNFWNRQTGTTSLVHIISTHRAKYDSRICKCFKHANHYTTEPYSVKKSKSKVEMYLECFRQHGQHHHKLVWIQVVQSY